MQDNDMAWKFLFDDNPQPMWVMDMDEKTFRFLAVNDAALAVYGHSRDEFLSMSALDIRPAEDHAAFSEMLRGLGPTDSEAGPWRHRRKDGTLFWTESYSHPVEFAGRAARLVTARDVSEREEALRALRDSEEKYRLLADSMYDVVSLHDLEGNFLYVSPSVTKLTGFSVEETLGKNADSVVHPEDRARIYAESLWQLNEHKTSLVEWRRLCKDGSYRWFETRASLVDDDPARRSDFFESSSTQVRRLISGKTAAPPRSGDSPRQAALVCSSRDITKRKTAEEALRQSEALLRRVVTGAPVILYAVDRDGRVTLSEGEGLAALGFSPGQLVGTSIFDLYDTLPDIAEDRRRAMEGETFTTVRDVSGLVFETRYSPLRDQRGDRAGFVAVATNITERRQIEDALLQAERDYRTIFENSLDGIFQTTPDGRYLRANPALARLFGYESPDDLIRSLPNISEQLYLDPQHRARFIQELQEQGVVSGFEAQVRRRDGVILWIAEHARAVRDETGKLLYYEGAVQDITARKTWEAERERILADAIARADRDALTGLANHRAFHNRLREEAERAERQNTPLAVVMLDLDNFKFFNDAYGHAAGDDVLRQVADVLRQDCRSYDTLARFGGDEFALLMPKTDCLQAEDLTERLKTRLARTGYHPPDSDLCIPITLSAGIAVFPEDGPSRLDALEAADARLRHTKSGGNQNGERDDWRRELSSDPAQGFSMLDALVTAVDNKDRYTRRHSEDVMRYSLQIARQMGMDEARQQHILTAALLHDVGKIGVPDSILRKPGRLTEDEYHAIRQHPLMGSVIVGAVPGFEETLEAIRHHHERWDGQGYPLGLRGEETPLSARLLAVADAFSAMTTDRPYRKGLNPAAALDILQAGAGTQWDLACVESLMRAFTEE